MIKYIMNSEGRRVALKDFGKFGKVKNGDIGGYIERYGELSQENAKAIIKGHGIVGGIVYDDEIVKDLLVESAEEDNNE